MVQADRVDEQQPFDTLWPGCREPKGDRASQIQANHSCLGEAQGRQGPVHELGLAGDSIVGIEGPVGLAVAEQVERERGAVGERDFRPDVPPHEAGRGEAMQQDDGRTSVAVPLDMHRAGPYGNAQQVSVYGKTLDSDSSGPLLHEAHQQGGLTGLTV